jgi:hypothetical protein
MKLLFLLYFITISINGFSQKKSLSIYFKPTYNLLPLELGKKYPYKNDSIEITSLKFYISNIRFYQDNKLVDETEKKVYLIDVEKPQSLLVKQHNLKNKKFSAIHFCIGVDSITNVSGAFGGDFDPTNGMYWTWQSGYINFKLEGTSKICPTRKNEFTFHIGGYQYPNNTIQQITVNSNNSDNISIDINVSNLLNEIKLDEFNQIMSPNEKAMDMAKKIKTIFTLTK